MSPMLSEHFGWAEVTRSPTATARGIGNHLPLELYPNVERTAALMEQVRELLGGAVRVTSWFRCLELNISIGGSKSSAHMKGLAVDWQPTTCTIEEAFDRVARSDLIFDQLIHERTKDGAHWIHLGLSEGAPRRQVLAASGQALGGPMAFTRVALG